MVGECFQTYFVLAFADMINGRDFLLGKISHRGERIFRRGNQLVLCGRNCGHQAPFLINLRINLQLFADLFDDVLAVIRIVNRKICRIAEVVDVTSQNPHAGGVKRRNPDLFRAVPDQIVHSFTHLPGSFIGKGDRQNIPRLYAFVLNQIGNTVRQHPGLSASHTQLGVDLSGFTEGLSVPVTGGTRDSVAAVPAAEPEAALLEREYDELTREVELPRFVYAPVEAGQVLGEIRLLSGDKVVWQSALVADSDVPALTRERQGILEFIGSLLGQ